MNQENPSERIEGYYVKGANKNDKNLGDPAMASLWDVRREIDALNDRLVALEKRQNDFECGVGFKLSQTKTEKQALASCEHNIKIKNSTGYIRCADCGEIVTDAFSKPESEKVWCEDITWSEIVHMPDYSKHGWLLNQINPVVVPDHWKNCPKCAAPRPESAHNLTAFMKDMNEKRSPAKGPLAKKLHDAKGSGISAGSYESAGEECHKFYDALAKAAVDEFCLQAKELNDNVGLMSPNDFALFMKSIKDRLL